MAIDYAEEPRPQPCKGDRARTRLYACQLSRVTGIALLTVADIFAEPRGTTA
jgi:hypothetical protein